MVNLLFATVDAGHEAARFDALLAGPLFGRGGERVLPCGRPSATVSQPGGSIVTMGVHNKERRRQKKAKRDRRARAATGRERFRDDAWTSSAMGFTMALALMEAAEAVFHGREDASELLDLLVTGPPAGGGRRMVAEALREELASVVEALAGCHWYPGEIVRQARRRVGAAGAEVAAAVTREVWLHGGRRSTDPAWDAEAAGLGTQCWALDPGAPTWGAAVETGVKVLGLLQHLPPLPVWGPDAGDATRCRSGSGQDRALEKARHLLSKAESTTFPDEAEALTAKAQELLTRHSIDRAAVEGAGRSQRRPPVTARRIWVDDPYLMAKAQLLHVVASANRCRSVIMGTIGLATVAGHEDDLATVEVLFTSLLVQATTQMTAAGTRTDPSGRRRTRSFRQSFLVAFAIRIGQRLKEAEEACVSAGATAHGTDFLPVLASRVAAADEVIDELFPELEHRGSQATDAEGWAAGTLAADLSTLSAQAELFDAVA